MKTKLAILFSLVVIAIICSSVYASVQASQAGRILAGAAASPVATMPDYHKAVFPGASFTLVINTGGHRHRGVYYRRVHRHGRWYRVRYYRYYTNHSYHRHHYYTHRSFHSRGYYRDHDNSRRHRD